MIKLNHKLHGQGSTVWIIGFKSIQDPQFSDHSRPSHSTIAVETGPRSLFLPSLLTQAKTKLYQPHIDVSKSPLYDAPNPHMTEAR